MNSAGDPRELHEWDAAYVLGALSPDDRRSYEAHLEECPECRASVAELAGMPALLAKVSPPPVVEERANIAPPRQPSADLLPVLIHRVRRRRRARRWSVAGAALLAVVIAVAVVLPTVLTGPPPPTTRLTLAQTQPGPISASVALTEKRWGTDIAMTCSYDSVPGEYSTTGHYALYVTDAAGEATQVASWSAWPGATVHASAAVDTQESQLRMVEVRDASTGAVLLSSPMR